MKSLFKPIAITFLAISNFVVYADPIECPILTPTCTVTPSKCMNYHLKTMSDLALFVKTELLSLELDVAIDVALVPWGQDTWRSGPTGITV